MTGGKRKHDIDDAIVNYVVENMEPFNTVEKSPFKRLISTVHGKPIPIISRPTLMSKMSDKYIKMEENLKTVLSNLHKVCVTFDCWSSRNR